MPYDASEPFTKFTPRPLSPAIGAELIGADLREVDETLFEEVRQALLIYNCLLYTSPSPRDLSTSRMPSSA